MRLGTVPVSCLDIAPSIRNKLLDAGFRTVSDLNGCGPIDLAKGAALIVLDI